MSTPRRLVSSVVLVCVIVLAACGSSGGSSGGPRPLTDAQAQRLAVIRFNNYNSGVRAISGTLTDGRSQVAIRGWADLAHHVGYALAMPSGDDAATDGPFLVTWTLGKVATADVTATLTDPPLPIPADVAWQPTTLDPATSFLATALAVTLNLGYDRPENPLLLAQSTARFLRKDTVRGVPVEVFTGPDASSATDASVVPTTVSSAAGDAAAEQANLRYWVDDKGVLHRVELRLGAGAPLSVLDLTDAAGVTLAAPSAVAS